MATTKQREANRQNALRSTGPTTPAGKAAVGKNAVTHGLSSTASLLPGEDPEEWERFRAGISAELNPSGELESAILNRIVTLLWKLRRLSKIEAGVLSWRYYEVLKNRAEEKAKTHTKVHESAYFEPFVQTIEVLDAGQHQAAVSEKNTLAVSQTEDAATWGLAFIRDTLKDNTLAKLSRYESSTERSLFKAMHELERLQARRQGHFVPPPLAIDIDISGEQPPTRDPSPDEDEG